MTTSPARVLQALLANPRDLANVKSVTTPDVTYVSLNEDNPELKRYLPWTGTNRGPEAIVRAFEGIGRASRSEEHTSELQSRLHLVCRLLLEKKKLGEHPLSPHRTCPVARGHGPPAPLQHSD